MILLRQLYAYSGFTVFLIGSSKKCIQDTILSIFNKCIELSSRHLMNLYMPMKIKCFSFSLKICTFLQSARGKNIIGVQLNLTFFWNSFLTWMKKHYKSWWCGSFLRHTKNINVKILRILSSFLMICISSVISASDNTVK